MKEHSADMPPIDWPSIEVAGETYEVKWSLVVAYRASKAGVDIRNLKPCPETFATFIDIFAIIVRPVFEAKSLTPPTGEQWAEKIASFDKSLEISQAINRAFLIDSKMRPAAVPPTPQATAQQGTAPN
jgi:hypothetical protein